jgi:hypothetical protein
MNTGRKHRLQDLQKAETRTGYIADGEHVAFAVPPAEIISLYVEAVFSPFSTLVQAIPNLRNLQGGNRWADSRWDAAAPFFKPCLQIYIKAQ